MEINANDPSREHQGTVELQHALHSSAELLRSHSYENATCGMRLCDPLGCPLRSSAAHRHHTSNGDPHNNGCYLRLHPRRTRVALHARRSPGHLQTGPPRRSLLGMALRGPPLRLVAPQLAPLLRLRQLLNIEPGLIVRHP